MGVDEIKQTGLMKNGNKRIGIDIGGSHASVSVIDMDVQGQQLLNLQRKEINSFWYCK